VVNLSSLKRRNQKKRLEKHQIKINWWSVKKVRLNKMIRRIRVKKFKILRLRMKTNQSMEKC
jgi:predicted metal-dependent phosphoesterase TrpH